MDKIGKIRKKIEALLNDWKYGSSTEAKYRYEVYKELLEDFDNIEEEPVSDDLEAEMQRYYVDWDEHPQYTQTARHFAKWQKAKDKETIELAEDHAMLAGMGGRTQPRERRYRRIPHQAVLPGVHPSLRLQPLAAPHLRHDCLPKLRTGAAVEDTEDNGTKGGLTKYHTSILLAKLMIYANCIK